MAENCKGETLDSAWTLVVNRRKKPRNRKKNPKTQALDLGPWIPTDGETDVAIESRLMKKMQSAINRVQGSIFYRKFVDQFRNPQFQSKFSRVLGSESHMQMVIFGIGKIESCYDKSCLQLALAILIKKEFDLIGDIEIFDPVISLAESRVMEALGCSVLSVNEQGRRLVAKPTLFFMPHCEAFLYDNLLEANWCPNRLSRIVVLGNSFCGYERFLSEVRSPIEDSARHILEIRKCSVEFEIDIGCEEEFMPAFNEISWHFFDLDPTFDLKVPKREDL